MIFGMLKFRQEHFVIDGETVVLGPDGVPDFAALHSGRHNKRAQLYAFDMLAGDGEDQRQLPLSLRKINLARLLKRRIPGIFIAEYEQGEIGRDLFRVACSMGLEGIVSKRRDSAPVWVHDHAPASVVGQSGARRRPPRYAGVAVERRFIWCSTWEASRVAGAALLVSCKR